MSFPNPDSCDERYRTPNSLRSCECGLGDSKFLLKYHPSFPDLGKDHLLLPCTVETGRGSTEHNFLGKYSYISRKLGREAGDTPNLSWLRVDGLTVIYVGCHTVFLNWDIGTVVLDHIPLTSGLEVLPHHCPTQGDEITSVPEDTGIGRVAPVAERGQYFLLFPFLLLGQSRNNNTTIPGDSQESPKLHHLYSPTLNEAKHTCS